MAKQIQLRRGTEAENNAFTGALAELTADITNKSLRLHDGVTAGGISLVNSATNQTIAGIKTFTSSPIVPTPTTDFQVATKKYVDNNIAPEMIWVKPPSRRNKPLFTKVNPHSVSIPAGFKVAVNNKVISLSTDYILSLDSNLDAGTKTAGKDYYVYAKDDGTFYISANEAITIDKLIGGFHYGLVGEAESATGNKTESDMAQIRGINAYSFWDLKFRPVASPKGMVFVKGRWYDIYLCNSEHITNGTSKAGATIAGGGLANGRAYPKIPLEFGGDNTLTYGSFKWFHACEIAKSHSKELIDYAEFQTVAYGVVEGESSDDGTTNNLGDDGSIQHFAKFTSKYGLEQITGVQWTWGKDIMNGHGTTDFSWKDVVGRGQAYATSNSPIAAIFGGDRAHGASAGSRAVHLFFVVWSSVWSIGCRLACDHMQLK